VQNFSIALLSDKPWGMGKSQSVGFFQSRKAKLIHGSKGASRQPQEALRLVLVTCRTGKAYNVVLTHVLTLSELRSHNKW